MYYMYMYFINWNTVVSKYKVCVLLHLYTFVLCCILQGWTKWSTLHNNNKLTCAHQLFTDLPWVCLPPHRSGWATFQIIVSIYDITIGQSKASVWICHFHYIILDWSINDTDGKAGNPNGGKCNGFPLLKWWWDAWKPAFDWPVVLSWIFVPPQWPIFVKRANLISGVIQRTHWVSVKLIKSLAIFVAHLKKISSLQPVVSQDYTQIQYSGG